MNIKDIIDPTTDRLRTDLISLGGRLYVKCADCGQYVRINKPFVGSLHLCVEDRSD